MAADVHVRDPVRPLDDYQAFVLSRIRDARDRGLQTKDAIARAIKTTAGTVTRAAVVTIGAFSIFATFPIMDTKEMGIRLAAAVLIDATLVRAVPLPTMRLLDERQLIPAQLAGMAAEARAGHTTRPQPGLTPPQMR